MDSKTYTEGLAELRGVRDEIKPRERQLAKLQAELDKLRAQRDEKVRALGAYQKAKSDRLATSAGLSVIDVVALVPSLGPQAPVSAPAESPVTGASAEDPPEAQKGVRPIKEAAGAPAPDLRPQSLEGDDRAAALTRPREAAADGAFDLDVLDEPAPATAAAPSPAPVAPAAVIPDGAQERTLPSIPEGVAGDRWIYAESNLASKRPNFKQATRQMAFLDTATGVLVWQGGTVTLDLGRASVAEILTAVYATVPADVERIYITAGDPWHQNAGRHQFLKDAVAEWLNGPLPEGWQVESSRGKDRQAGHLVHPRNPVGRWQRGKDQHSEIRSVGEWFDPAGADPATIRAAFVELWKALRRHWDDVVLMGSPSQTGRDLWSRTIPAKAGAKWADGYPVMSQEIRGLLHATAGQGRTELITPPRVPERVPGWYEADRTFAYAKHTWTSGVGVPQRVTAAAFAAMSEKEQADALFSPSHWQVRVTIPRDWDHVGLLPAPAPGERSWRYPYEGGRTFITWAGGAEVNLALRNPLQPWRIEILDGLVWEKGDPLKDWSNKLKDVWRSLRALGEVHGDEQQRQAARLASRAVRSILLYGIGTFAQRPRITTGSLELGAGGEVPEIPDGTRLTGLTDTHVTWERNIGFARDQYAHPEWAAVVWSAARAALLSGPTGTKDPETGKPARAGALHLPAGSILAFRTDAIYSSVRPDWPYSGEPGDYLLKGAMSWEQSTPTTDEEFYVLQALGRQALEAEEL
ncbi:Mucin-19 [Streptomyces agglomeratus]|uniref:Mucin-19 n=1 Tax=Streptomyces agglomeratus TaxID=285458 RepID=A0A1E5NZ28_9ACTN|nr:Mucin-19 [Streptomyces agglomeratus]OEJ21567.1 Mucin-19 [Streptomyces agglomeratus]